MYPKATIRTINTAFQNTLQTTNLQPLHVELLRAGFLSLICGGSYLFLILLSAPHYLDSVGRGSNVLESRPASERAAANKPSAHRTRQPNVFRRHSSAHICSTSILPVQRCDRTSDTISLYLGNCCSLCRPSLNKKADGGDQPYLPARSALHSPTLIMNTIPTQYTPPAISRLYIAFVCPK